MMLGHAPQGPVLSAAELTATAVANPDLNARFLVMPSERFGFAIVMSEGEAGAYLTPSGEVAARWTSRWERPEEWMFDLHATLLAGEPGELINGVFALAGLMFIITGVFLWWPARRLFELRLWPRSMKRAQVIRHHRDLGIVLAPLLAVSLVTGALLTLRPLAIGLMLPFSSPAELRSATSVPPVEASGLSAGFEWNAAFAEAAARFPDATVRVVGIPRQPNQPVFIRMRQPGEWVDRGRTMVWFHPQSGAVVSAEDAHTAPRGLRVYYGVLPLHTGEVGGWIWRWLVTLTGLGMTLLGTLAVWTFWLANPPKRLANGASSKIVSG
jgi:uncharacterized iron-regulated membrane protein